MRRRESKAHKVVRWFIIDAVIIFSIWMALYDNFANGAYKGGMRAVITIVLLITVYLLVRYYRIGRKEQALERHQAVWYGARKTVLFWVDGINDTTVYRRPAKKVNGRKSDTT